MPEEIDGLATVGAEAVSVLVWRHADDQYATDAREAAVTLRIERPPFDGAARVSHWRIDARHSNSHAAWQAFGNPQDPSETQLRAIQARQGLEALEPDRCETVREGVLTLQLALPLPSVSLVEIRPAP
jgi:xylan 1,4-beta-xylosidase